VKKERMGSKKEECVRTLKLGDIRGKSVEGKGEVHVNRFN